MLVPRQLGIVQIHVPWLGVGDIHERPRGASAVGEPPVLDAVVKQDALACFGCEHQGRSRSPPVDL